MCVCCVFASVDIVNSGFFFYFGEAVYRTTKIASHATNTNSNPVSPMKWPAIKIHLTFDSSRTCEVPTMPMLFIPDKLVCVYLSLQCHPYV